MATGLPPSVTLSVLIRVKLCGEWNRRMDVPDERMKNRLSAVNPHPS